MLCFIVVGKTKNKTKTTVTKHTSTISESLSLSHSFSVTQTSPTETNTISESLSSEITASITLGSPTETTTGTFHSPTYTGSNSVSSQTLANLTKPTPSKTRSFTATHTLIATESTSLTKTLTKSLTISESQSLPTYTNTETIYPKPKFFWDGFIRFKKSINPEDYGLEKTRYSSWPGTFLSQLNTTYPLEFDWTPHSEWVDSKRKTSIAQFLLKPDSDVVLPFIFDVIGPDVDPSMEINIYIENNDGLYTEKQNFQTATHAADVHAHVNITDFDYITVGENNVTVIIMNSGAGWAGKTTIIMEVNSEGVNFGPFATPWIAPYHKCQWNETKIICEIEGIKSKYPDDIDSIQPIAADPYSVENHHNPILPWKYELPITLIVDQYFNGTVNFTVDIFTENDHDISNNRFILNPVVYTPDLRPLIVWPTWPETAYELRIYNDGPTTATDVRTVFSVDGGNLYGVYDPQVVNPHGHTGPDPGLISLPLGLREGSEHEPSDQDCFASETGDFLRCVIAEVPYDPALTKEKNYVSRWFRVDVFAEAQLSFKGTITNEDRNLANNGVAAMCPVHSECWTDVKIVQVTGCLDIWPSTANCPPDGSTSLTIWGQGFGLDSDSRIQAYVGGGKCESLVWHNATDYTQNPLWEHHQVLICDDYLGYQHGDQSPESTFAYGNQENSGNKLYLKEEINLPITVVNWRERNKTEDWVTVSFASHPVIYGIDNCGETNATWTGCPTSGTTSIEIMGKNFVGYGGFGAVDVMFGHFPCVNVTVLNDTSILCTKYSGL